MRLKSFNSGEITNKAFNAADLGNAQFSDIFPGEVGGNLVLFARIEYSWAGVTGGDATSILNIRGHVLTSNDPVVPSAGSAAVAMHARIGSTAASGGSLANPGVSLGMTGANPAAGSEYADIWCPEMTGTTLSGTMTPFPKWWTLRLTRAGAVTWTAGTLTITGVTLYG